MFSGLIKGELMRFVRTATNVEDYIARANLFKHKLLLRGYGKNEFQSAYSEVHHSQREEYLKGKTKTYKKDKPLVFTTTYNPYLRGFSRALTRHWEIISKHEKLSKIFPKTPMIAYRRGHSLRDSLVRARIHSMPDGNNTTGSDELDILISLLEKDPDACVSTPH